MTVRRFQAAVAFALATLAAACGGSDGGPGVTFADSVSTAVATSYANGAAQYAGYVSRAMNFGGPSILTSGPAMTARLLAPRPAGAERFPGWTPPAPDLALLDWRDRPARVRGIQRAAAEGCTTTVRGSVDPWGDFPVDANGNDIPDDLYLKYVCVQTDSTGGDTVVTETHTQEIHYKEIAGSLYGLTVSLFEESRVGDNHRHYELTRYDIDGTLDIRHTGLTDRSTYTIRTEYDPGTGVVFAENGESWSNVFTPSGQITGNTAQLPAGDLFLTGRRYHIDSEGQNLSFAITTPVALKYYTPCVAADSTPPFTAGTLRGELNGRSTNGLFEVGFIACGQYVVSVDSTFDGVAPR